MPARDRQRLANRAFTLAEMLVALGLVTVALGAATTLLISAHRRFRRATDAAAARARLSLAADRMLADVRGSSGAEERGGALAIARPGDKVTWFARKGVLVRECGGDEDIYDLGLARVRVAVEPRPGGAPLVEVAFELATAPKRRVPGTPAPVLYVAASPRLGGAP
ncbi:MAG: type II secretion system protein [Planctomycetota bacterium]|jgi:prepilin-type N-terminal cleavage/methylation domain-containing protein